MHKKTQLALGVATAAMISGFATPANAACTVDGSTVTCTSDSTAAEVNAAMAAAAGSNVTLNIATDANVTQPGAPVFPTQQGSVAIDNAGDLGADAARVGVFYSGTSTDTANTFDLANSGLITGSVATLSVGGAVDIANSGLLAEGVYIQLGQGPATLTNTGQIDSTGSLAVYVASRTSADAVFNGDVGTAATDTSDSDLRDSIIQSQFFESLPSTSETETVGGVTTTTNTSGFTRVGGTASASVGEGANTGSIQVVGLDGAEIAVEGSVGTETEFDSVIASSNPVEGATVTVSQTDGTDSSFTQINSQTAIGSTAAISIGETGSVSGNVEASGLQSASVTVDGAVGNENFFSSVSANSQNTDFVRTNSSATTGTVSASSFEETNDTVGGTAAVAIGGTGSVTGQVSASGFAGADVSIDGTVGSPDNPSFVSANSSGNSSTFAQESVFDSATGASAFAQASTNSSTGSDASIAIGESGVTNGSVDAFANGDASIANEGTVSGSVFASASGSDSSNGSVSSSDGSGNSESANFSTSEDTGGSASIDNAAGGLIGLEATSPVSVNAFGNTSARVTNAGRINGNVSVQANGSASQNSSSNSFASSTDAATGTTTSVNQNAQANANTNLGGDASFANAAGGLVTGQVNVNGAGSAAVTNEGAVIGTTFASSRATDSASSSASTDTTVIVSGAAGGTTNTFEQTQTSSNASSGGDVTGIYAGTNGAVQFAPFGGASDGSVTQVANGTSSAVVSGTIFGGFTGEAFGNEFSSTFSSASETVFDADGDLRSSDSSSSRDQTDRQSDSNSSLLVDGGTITGSASLYAPGSASAQIANGGAIDGSLSLTAQADGGYDYTESNSSSDVYDEDGVFVGGESVSERSFQRIASAGDVTTVIGEGTVGGSVSMNGAAGTNSFTLGSEGIVGGSVSQQSNSQTDGFDETRTTTRTATASGAIDTVQTFESAQTFTASGGNVNATVAGSIGNGVDGPQDYGSIANAGGTSLALSTNAGNAQATVTGQVRNGISVTAAGSDTTSATQQTIENGATTAFASQNSSTATGGTASLVVNAANTAIPANFGNIQVRGRSGSTVSIGANSTVLAATNGAFMSVGGNFFDTTSTQVNTYNAGGLRGQVSTFERNNVGGNASLINNGRIGFDGGTGFSGTNANVFVTSPTNAEATNLGQIFGSITVRSLFEDFSSTTTQTDIGEVTQVNIIDRTYTANGGAATLTNAGLITGSASLAALDGTAVNSGVLRGNLALGGNVDNYTTRATDTLTQLGEEEVLDLAEAIEQGYAVEQNGLLGGIIAVNGAFGQIDDTVRTSNITADVALNAGSVTVGGVVAEYDEESGERFTTTNVALNGSGYLGLGATGIDALEDAFGTIDPEIAAAGDLSAFAGGARVLGVDTVTKTGSGVFLITGADFAPTSNTNRFADYTFDIGSFAITGGEVQLATIGDEGVFGIRGNITNSAGLVLGSRVQIPAPLFGTNGSVTAIDGVEVYQNGNFAQSGSGTLSVGVTPTLVRVFDPAFLSGSTSTNPLAVQQIGLTSGLFTTPEKAFGQAFTDLGTGFLTVDGNMNLGGTVQLVSPTGGLFTDGQTVDIASVSGTVTTGAAVAFNSPSNFVTFDLGTRTEGGRTIVFASADRAGFETAGNNQNAVAAGTALSQAFPDVVATIQAGSAGGIGIGGDQFVMAQDMTNIFVGFDSLLTMDQVTTALNELASGEFYGSLTALETTAPFVDAISSRRVPAGASGFNVWFAPSGDFVEIEGDAAVGSSDLDANNYGGSAGFGIATGNGEIGIGFGYGQINADARNDLLQAEADTWMVGAYVRQGFGNFSVGADLVYGWSDWTASRTMPTLSRIAMAQFDSTELRGDLRAEYMFDFGGGWVAPFGQLSFRKFNLDGFTEEGAGSLGLVVEEADDTVLTPILGLRAGTTFDAGMATLRPELSLSYSFNDDNSSFRDVAYLGAPNNSFRLQGVEPEGYFTIGAGLFADIGANSGAFVRGSYATGGNVNVSSVNAGVTIGF